jgi:hypothetical protein
MTGRTKRSSSGWQLPPCPEPAAVTAWEGTDGSDARQPRRGRGKHTDGFPEVGYDPPLIFRLHRLGLWNCSVLHWHLPSGTVVFRDAEGVHDDV